MNRAFRKVQNDRIALPGEKNCVWINYLKKCLGSKINVLFPISKEDFWAVCVCVLVVAC